MPRTTKSSDPAFQIEVAAPPGWTFAAGDTVIGNVVLRCLPFVAPEATVTLALLGRTKTKITVSRGQNGRSRYRGRWHFFAPSPKQLFHGPLHLPQDGSCENSITWPFSITIPTGPDASVRNGHLRDDSFLPLDEWSIAQQSLPGTFFSRNYGFIVSSEGFVEYHLEACLRYSRGGSPENKIAISPLTLRHIDGGNGFVGFDLQRCVIERKIQSHKLLPGMKHVPLSFKQKTEQLFGSSKVPEFHYKVEILSPRMIQLDNPSPIPFTISLIPQQDKTSVEIRDVVQIFRLNGVKTVLRSKTRLLAPSNIGHISHDDTHFRVHDLQLQSAFQQLEDPVIICNEKGHDSVNIANLFQLILRPDGLSAGGRHLAMIPIIHPDFVTYNIHHSNTLEWEVSLDVLGETQKIRRSTRLTILPAA